jgi:hypothetical protein
MYLAEMITTSDQKISERTPRTLSGVGVRNWWPMKATRNA